jgi:ribosomal 30S subunit maturation factor RimM
MPSNPVEQLRVLSANKRPDPRDSSYGQDYWLHRCEGFTVQRAQRALGKVTGLRFHASIEPELLEVRTSLLGRRILIPVEQVQQIEPKTRRVILGASGVAEAGR